MDIFQLSQDEVEEMLRDCTVVVQEQRMREEAAIWISLLQNRHKQLADRSARRVDESDKSTFNISLVSLCVSVLTLVSSVILSAVKMHESYKLESKILSIESRLVVKHSKKPGRKPPETQHNANP